MATLLPELLVTDPAALRAWLEEHHATSPGVRLVLTKKGGSDTTITWASAVEELLCFGWIDGQAGKRDEDSYTVRITPRRPKGSWSQRNVALAGLAVDPAEAEQLLDRARPRDRGVRAALLGQHQPHAGRRRVVLFEPRPQRGRVGHEQLGQQGCHGSDASRGRRHLRRSGGEPEEGAEHEVEPVVASGGAAGQVAGARDR